MHREEYGEFSENCMISCFSSNFPQYIMCYWSVNGGSTIIDQYVRKVSFMYQQCFQSNIEEGFFSCTRVANSWIFVSRSFLKFLQINLLNSRHCFQWVHEKLTILSIYITQCYVMTSLTSFAKIFKHYSPPVNTANSTNTPPCLHMIIILQFL